MGTKINLLGKPRFDFQMRAHEHAYLRIGEKKYILLVGENLLPHIFEVRKEITTDENKEKKI